MDDIKKIFRITTDRMYTAVGSFHIWKKLNQMLNTNEVGVLTAERNCEIFKKYGDFFVLIINSSYKSFVSDLSIFFDAEKYEGTFSLNKLVKMIGCLLPEEQHKKLLQDIAKIKKLHGFKISFILELRNADVSHQEVDRKKREVIYKDIEELFIGVQEILNLLSKHYDNSTTMWNHVEEYIIRDIDWIVDNLERGEKVRINEIYEKYNI